MIADLIEFGEWLSQNKQDEFAKNLNEAYHNMLTGKV